jgi:hypothetical protein
MEKMAGSTEAGGRKPNRMAELIELAWSCGLADIYAFGSRAGEIAAAIRNDEPLQTGSSSDADIGV